MKIVFSLLYTTVRPPRVSEVVQLWHSRAQHPELIEFVMTFDHGDAVTKKAMLDILGESVLGKLKSKVQVQEQPELPGTCVKGWNLAATYAVGHIFICLSDDFVPPQHWDKALMNLPGIGPRWGGAEAVVRVDDGYVRDLCTLPILTRRRYDKFGYVFHPGYLSIFSDTEFTFRAAMDGVLLDAGHLLFEHKHCDNQKRSKDAVDENHGGAHRYRQGELLFSLRKALGFPTDMGPLAEKYLATERGDFSRYAVFIQAIKDDFCLWETVKRIYEEGVRAFFFVTPNEYWDGKKTSEGDIAQVKAIADRLRDAYTDAKVDHQIVPVQPFRAGARNRIDVETNLRNSILDYIREQGYYHILIADGDELWLRGFLKQIDDVVVDTNPMAVTINNVPVIGLPGYPVDRAKDKVTVYVRADSRFRDCRSPYAAAEHVDAYALIHFSAVRRTNEELAAKMRASGHYDDPSYRFEDFIDNTLPTVKPGMKNVHMFVQDGFENIWPAVRVWTQEEWDSIPSSIKDSLSDEVDDKTPPIPFTPPAARVRNMGLLQTI